MHRAFRRRWFWITLAGFLVLLIAGRLALPGWTARYLNDKLERMGDYHGQIQGVELHLWRGAYSIDELRIEKRSGKVPVPLLHAARIDLSVSWHALLAGGIVASVDFQRPELNFVDSKGKAIQTGAGVDWRARLEGLLPIRLDEVRVHDGIVHFRNFSTEPKVDLRATEVNGRVINLTNVRAAGQRAADLELTAQILGQAPLETRAKFDPLGSLEDFTYRVRVDKIDLRRLNEFLRAYAHLDVESGEGDFVMELEAHAGQLDGYAKPLFHHVKVFSVKQDLEREGDNPLRALWEAVAGGIENLFKNQSQDQFATRVEIHGRTDNADTSAWQAIVAVLHNAFVQAYRPQFEDLPTRKPAADDSASE